MNILIEFLVVFKGYLVEVLPFLFIGFLLSGLIHEFIPSKLMERHLGGKGIKPILYTTPVGTCSGLLYSYSFLKIYKTIRI